MNYNKLPLLLLGSLLVGDSAHLRAEDTSWSDTDRFDLSYRMGFNISTKFRNIGTPALANNPSVTGLSYQNGFVSADNTGNAGGLTTFWGYQNANQVVDNNSSLVMRSSNSGDLGSSVDNPQNGLELTYAHEIGHSEKVRWGIEAAFNWTDFSANQSGVPPAGAMAVDAFPLGYSPPQAPYTGTPNAGPFTPLLGTTPTRLPVTVSSSLEAEFYGLRLGPYLDLPLSKRLLVTFSAGVALSYVDGDYKFTETYTTPAGASVSTSGHASSFSPVWGGFVGAQVSLKLSDHLSVFTGLMYQGAESYVLQAVDKEAEIDLSGALYWSTGFSYSF
jgi:hypothetical protein